jgi:hypothetical protein
VYKKRSIRNTGENFLLAPAISNPKYAPAESGYHENGVARETDIAHWEFCPKFLSN